MIEASIVVPDVSKFFWMKLGSQNWIIFGFQKCNKFCKKIIDFPFSVALLFREPLENVLEIVSTNKLKKISKTVQICTEFEKKRL